MNRQPSVAVWDLPVRVVHWSLLALVIAAFATSETEGVWFRLHLAAGYGVMGLVVFRLAWGVVGTRYALFGDFVRPWPAVRRHIADVLSLRPAGSVGHDPLGGWMIVALLAVLAALVASGLFAGEHADKGPLAHLVGRWLADGLGGLHDALNTVLWTLVAFHVAGVVVESLLSRDNLVRAMWTGRKPVDAGAAVATGPVGALALTASLALAVGAVAAVAW